MSLIFIFIDGLGIGPSGKNNPFSEHSLPGLEWFAGGKLTSEEFREVARPEVTIRRIDAKLDVEGLPQSGTGQATLFSGQNAAKLLGRHHGPYPHTKIKPLLGASSMFGSAKEMGLKCHFMNAFPDRFFEYAEKRNRWSCTTKMCIENGIALNRVTDVREGRAITAEIFQDIWQSRLGIELPDIDEHTAAGRIFSAADRYDLVLYEFYLTDKAGHAKRKDEAIDALSRIDLLLGALAHSVDKSRHTLLITSDHGNIEDLSIKTHTMNPVPLLVYGSGAEKFTEITSLTEVSPALLNWLAALVWKDAL